MDADTNIVPDARLKSARIATPITSTFKTVRHPLWHAVITGRDYAVLDYENRRNLVTLAVRSLPDGESYAHVIIREVREFRWLERHGAAEVVKSSETVAIGNL